MSTSLFHLKEHVVPCQHIREYPLATANDQDDVLHIAVKQYIPRSNPHPKPGDVTILGAHANGFPKELYEPLWDELLQRAEKNGFRIRGIWIADAAHQGASSVLNEGKLGNDPSWMDLPRDLLHMINTFRSEMPRPIVGIGHSMGGHNLVNLSLMHPRLLETLVLIDPVIQRYSSLKGNFSPARASTTRRDLWPSREMAKTAFMKSKFYQGWDPRVLDRWVKYGLRELPTLLYPDADLDVAPVPDTTTGLAPTTAEPTAIPPIPKQVTLTTTKHQEVFTFMRPNYSTTSSRLTHPDITPMAEAQTPIYRPEPIITYHNLPHVRPGVLYIFGALSPLSAKQHADDKMNVTGTGVGGSGGAKEGRVTSVLMQDVGHLIPMEKVGETADHTAAWLGAEMKRWKMNERVVMEGWERLPKRQKAMMDERFLQTVRSSVPAMPGQTKGDGSKL